MPNSLHVLVVEDSPVARTVAKLHFTKLGCSVDTAENGKAALEKALNTKYNVILMDIGLGEGPDGFEVTSEIKNNSGINQATPVIAVTAHGEPEYTDKAMACGIERYFNKPFTPIAAKEIIDYVNNKYPMGK
ncbi:MULTISPECIES: response regulator [Legionella]|uniref:Sensory histidine-kinase / response regulator n=1 Tax=Legionella drozanskii LLAP-1 TaxID=1212489 RepID=A0A0W0SPY2_9GAMM|nr:MULTISPECIES: response regulator [Legionella]KTC85462.1 sensory histidine-kinase / response regulator [Legionella drozanskii LLAP-1]PJE10730.1 MAG: response regulator [Legionella sp.]